MVAARPNRSRVDFVVLDRLEPASGTGTARVQVEIREVTALPDTHDMLTPWVGRTMTAVLPSTSPCLAPDAVEGGRVSSGYASLVGPGEIRLAVDGGPGPDG